MKSWDLMSIDVRPHSPEILESSRGGRAILLEVPAGESLTDHQVHEHAWLTVVAGDVTITASEKSVAGGVGTLIEFAPGERHAVQATSDARLLLILAPWPGDGHPGAMELEDKQTVRQRAAGYRRNA